LRRMRHPVHSTRDLLLLVIAGAVRPIAPAVERTKTKTARKTAGLAASARQLILCLSRAFADVN